MPANQQVAKNEVGIETAISVLKQRFDERLSTAQAVREQHGHTTTFLKNEAPDAVIFAHSTEEVSDIVRVCSKYEVPVIAFGTCLLYTSPSPRDQRGSRMPSSA